MQFQMIREFWFTERPDILEYMKVAYSDLNLMLLPDHVLNNGLNNFFLSLLRKY